MEYYCVANDNGEIVGHDLSKAKAESICSLMAEKEPEAGWEVLAQNEEGEE